MKNWGIRVKYRSAHTYIVLRLITKNYYYAGFASRYVHFYKTSKLTHIYSHFIGG